ncbi:hypothetical protein EG359_10275 [Chryseobacterium joostei]|uniref:Uncharacterized protein n=1 Tax=Chryseobacterium joostei TaxID=112234 RepID=A0A1N7KPX0_9FLAO|nr:MULTISPECIES: hypothetical protein [Chryseobacterium]AZA99978.1 hypothetical protein EG359_10240 [Chryseobacterium joostei]AZA99985.1 hypothetical protein EG359_10275 [Chryseobacterium joostei]PRA95092.1 hypothetical protein CQ046_22375 [Chryseobacterium sp. MYb7]SIS63653.1 hypothetical protein SAMN05421768_1186 [Chryseobacterium joostei]HCM32587.1 hypothetical protein [Chryseobacterium sp.]
MKNILLLLTFFVTSFTFAQEFTPPPPPKIEIAADKKVLVDELIKVTNFENYVYNYCKSIISQYAQQNKWDDSKTQQILENSNFKYFNQMLYYTFKDDSKEDLKDLIKSFKQINQKRKPDQFLIPNNFQIQKDLIEFTINVMQGQYILSKKK